MVNYSVGDSLHLFVLARPEEEDPPDRKRYDAFVAHHHDTEYDFVRLELLPRLEDELGCRLCVGTRDFTPGMAIAENIVEAIDNSRYIVHTFLLYKNNKYLTFYQAR